MRPKRRHELSVSLELIFWDCWNYLINLTAKEPREGVLQRVSIKAARQPPPWFLREADAVLRVTSLPLLKFKPFHTLCNGQRIDRGYRHLARNKTSRSEAATPP